MSIAKNIAALRKAKGYTQEQLGEILGVSNQAVSKWESAITYPDIMLLPKIADALDTTLNGLYGIADDRRDINEKINEFPRMAHTLTKKLFYEQLSVDSMKPFVKTEKDSEGSKIYIKAGCTLGAITYTAGGAAFISDKLSVVSSEFDLKNGGKIFDKREIASGMKKLCDANVRKVLSYMHSEAFKDTPAELSQLAVYFGDHDIFEAKFSLEELSAACHLSEDDTLDAIEKLISVHVAEVLHENDKIYYIFKKTKAIETAVAFEVFERLISESFHWGCGYLIANGTK